MESEKQLMKEDEHLSNSDKYFTRSLKCLLGGEILLVNRGIKKEVDRKMLMNWIRRHIK